MERSSGNGIAFAIGGRRLLRILPDHHPNYKNGSAIVISNPPASGLFRELLPPVGATVFQQLPKREAPLPVDYLPRDGDSFVFHVAKSGYGDKLGEQIKQLGERYQSAISNRLRAQGKKPTNGILTIKVNLAAGEKVSALTYYLNGDVVAIQNQPPFQIKLDTTRWANGEHLLEARAVDNNGAILTQKKTLLFVENLPDPPPADP